MHLLMQHTHTLGCVVCCTTYAFDSRILSDYFHFALNTTVQLNTRKVSVKKKVRQPDCSNGQCTSLP